MQTINYQKELERNIEKFQKNQQVPNLLLHSCCAPCSSYCLEYLSQYFSITVFYYNPNIAPEEEYHRRTKEQARLISEMPLHHKVSLITGAYEPERFYQAVKGLESIPEGGKRCEACFRLRLSKSAEIAKEQGIEYLTTTLTISPLKHAAVLNQIGEECACEYGIQWLPSDFKKRGGYQRSIQLSREYDLYRQDYCGCVFSKKEKNDCIAEKNMIK